MVAIQFTLCLTDKKVHQCLAILYQFPVYHQLKSSIPKYFIFEFLKNRIFYIGKHRKIKSILDKK